MKATFLIPIIVGFSAVMQGALNRRISGSWGLPSAVLLNALVMLLPVAAFFFVARNSGDALPAIMRPHGASPGFSWWYLIPGMLGFCIVVGIPWAIGEIGALAVFVVSIASQIAVSAAWDALIEGRPLSMQRVAGSLLAVAGALLATWKRG